MTSPNTNPTAWPELPYPLWADTCSTLHLWMQIVGKIRLARSPWVNHSWHVPLYLSTRGLTTSPMADGQQVFQIDFDFVDHHLAVTTSAGRSASLPLAPMSVADFYQQLMALLAGLGLEVRIRTTPNEVVGAIPFEQDRVHAAYDPLYANRYWGVLLQADRVFKQFRSGFTGKCSPVHLFWGSNDLAVTRFSGRSAPPHPGGIPNLPDRITREAYSHEVSSAGFWPGDARLNYAAFYSYAYPVPDDFANQTVAPPAAFFHQALGEFLLPYDAVRTASDPDATLLAFLHSTYEAAARTGDWDRAALEREPPAPEPPARARPAP